MIKFILFLSFLMASCAHQGSAKRRSFASGTSSATKCSIEKHQSQENFRLKIDEKLYNNYWYDEVYAKQILENLEKSGKCQ